MLSDSDFFEAIGLKPPGSTETAQHVAYFASLGAFVHVWAYWECIFDICIFVIYHRSPQGKTIDKRRPLALARKLRYFRKAHASIPALKQYADGAEKLAGFIERMSDLRHTIIHSANAPMETPLVREFRRILPDDITGDRVLEKRQKLDHQTIFEAAKLVTTLLAPTMTYAKLLMGLFPKDKD
jgi:hypothetical protein